jgi:ABC transporter substrate binding protein
MVRKLSFFTVVALGSGFGLARPGAAFENTSGLVFWRLNPSHHQSEGRQADRSDDTAECVGAGGQGDQVKTRHDTWCGNGGEKSMKKTTFILFILAALLFAPLYLAHAQKQATPRIGVLLLGAPPNANLDAFIEGLRELGYIEGKNILIEYRFAEGKAERLPELAIELVRLKVDAIFTGGTPAIFALKQATKTIPIV